MWGVVKYHPFFLLHNSPNRTVSDEYRQGYKYSFIEYKNLSADERVQSALAGGHRCAAQRPDCAPNGHSLGGRSGHREMTPGSRFPILQVADLGLIRTVKCFVARFKMALAEPSSFRITALQLFGSRWEQMNVLSFISLRFSKISNKSFASRSSVSVWSESAILTIELGRNWQGAVTPNFCWNRSCSWSDLFCDLGKRRSSINSSFNSSSFR